MPHYQGMFATTMFHCKAEGRREARKNFEQQIRAALGDVNCLIIWKSDKSIPPLDITKSGDVYYKYRPPNKDEGKGR